MSEQTDAWRDLIVRKEFIGDWEVWNAMMEACDRIESLESELANERAISVNQANRILKMRLLDWLRRANYFRCRSHETIGNR